nr:copia protein [Tanacetum cinerariifolium]
TGPTWLFDIDSLTRTMNYQPVHAGNQTNFGDGFQDNFDEEKAGEEVDQSYMLFPELDFDVKKPESKVILSPSSSAQSKEQDDKTKKEDKGKSHVESVTGYRDLNAEFKDCSENSSNEVNTASSTVSIIGKNSLNNTNTFSAPGPSTDGVSPTYGKVSNIDASQLPDDLDMPELEDIIYSDDEDVVEKEKFIKWVYKNKKDERGIVIRNKARLVAQGHTQEEGIDYEEVFSLVERIEAIRLFLAYASFMGFMVYEIDVKSAFLYETIEEEVYVCQPQGKSASTPIDTEMPLLKDPDGEDVDVHTYRSMIGSLMYLTSSRPDIMFAVCACCKKQTVIATSSTEAEYVAVASCCAQVLWIQNQLLDYGYIKYAITINPYIYMSCIKQFWNTVVVKQTNDVTMLQALVDKKKVKVFANMRRVGKRFSRVETPLFEGMLVGVIEEQGDAKEHVQDDVDDVAAQVDDTAVQGDDVPEPSIPSPTPPTPPP